MTQQYLIGELSLLLAQVQAAAGDDGAREAARLRREVEESRPADLSAVVARALRLTDRLCWEQLDQGDTAAFSRESACASDLLDFCVCARLIKDN